VLTHSTVVVVILVVAINLGGKRREREEEERRWSLEVKDHLQLVISHCSSPLALLIECLRDIMVGKHLIANVQLYRILQSSNPRVGKNGG